MRGCRGVDDAPELAQKIYLSQWNTLTLTDWMGRQTPRDGPLGYEIDWVAFTPLQNATGDPAISLPLGVSDHGLPIDPSQDRLRRVGLAAVLVDLLLQRLTLGAEAAHHVVVALSAALSAGAAASDAPRRASRDPAGSHHGLPPLISPA